MMLSLTYVIVLLALSPDDSLTKEVCCEEGGCFNDDYPFDHLPTPDCFPIFCTLHTRDTNSTPVIITPEKIPENVNWKRRTIFIIHGYRGDSEGSTWMSAMKDEFLKQADFNVILVDWGQGSKALWYPQSAANIRVTAHQVAGLSNALIQAGVAHADLYCVGHSLGGHTCGHVGKLVPMGRITGLDPAGPMFEKYPEASRLNPSDAQYVDVIHTMGDEGFIMDFGTLLPLGHADFYPNGGIDQPGCVNRRSTRIAGARGDGLGCSHGRAIDYFIESINTPCFATRHVCLEYINMPNSCEPCGGVCQSMGFASERFSTAGILYVETHSKSPFCQE